VTIDFTKPVQTRDGRPVRILCTDAPSCYPVVGLIEDEGRPIVWTLAGYWSEGNDRNYQLDLMNSPPPKKKVNVEIRLWEDAGGVVRSASNAMHTGKEWGDEPTRWLAATTIEMEYQP
jgi:hypothetical protein